MTSIAFIEALAGPLRIESRHLLELLEQPRALGIGQEFRGRISTRLFADDAFVLKLKTPYSLAPDKAEAWCRARLARERAFGIYLPTRHWLVLQQDEGCAIANVTPRHPTLEQTLQACRQAQQERTLLELLERYFECYFGFWTGHGQRQDEGLSNYVVVDGAVYYVDDDLYAQDDLVSFAHGIGHLLRTLELSARQADEIGVRLRQRLVAIDPVLPFSLDEHLAGVFVAEAVQPAMQALREALRSERRRASLESAAQPLSRPLAILADIHANDVALDAVLADMQAHGVEDALVLGDIVGYGPSPAACIARLRERNWRLIRGNHDHAIHLGEASERFNRSARHSIAWTLEQVDAADRAWLGQLPYFWHAGPLYAVHGAPVDASFMNAYVYQTTADHNLDRLVQRGLRLCFHGHSHIQGIWYRRPGGTTRFDKLSLLADLPGPFLVCPGSVGLPRDGARGAQYAIYDPASQQLSFREVPYDRDRLLARAREVDLPDVLMRLFL